jgi:hypothetical protein
MNEPMLRPRSAVEIIDAAFTLYRANFATLAAISLALLGPLKIIGVLVGGTMGVVISNLSGLFSPIVVGATVAVVSDAMHDRPISVGSAFGQIAGRWGTLVLVSFLQGLLTFLGLVLLIVPGLIVMSWTFAAPMAVVVERMDRTSGALSRSKQLARGQLGHILGTLALSWVIVLVLLFATGIGVGLVGNLLGLGDQIAEFLSSWAFILAMPVVGAASGILYFDLRIRTEAYDIERLTQTLGESAASPV